MNRIILKLAAVIILSGMQFAHAEILDDEEIRAFLDEMAGKHGFEQEKLLALLGSARISTSVLEAISRPAEAMPWFKYRKIFLRSDRIRQGVDFLRDNRELLEKASRQYGVSPAIITAIIGVETRYGRNAGSHRVIDALVTLGFRYPKRGSFFRRELEQFLLLTREQQLDPLSVTGSYAGAMGIPQFISSSYRHYAVDFDQDGRIDIWDNTADAIGSVANYLHVHGWEDGGKIAVRASASNENYRQAVTAGLELDTTLEKLRDLGVTADVNPERENLQAKLISLETEKDEELWIGFNNFYTITRYNRSSLYAMAVYQLADEIERGYDRKYGDLP